MKFGIFLLGRLAIPGYKFTHTNTLDRLYIAIQKLRQYTLITPPISE